jgi:hypothetical protein
MVKKQNEKEKNKEENNIACCKEEIIKLEGKER